MERLLSYAPWAAASLYSYGFGAAIHFLCVGGVWWAPILAMVEGIAVFWYGDWLQRNHAAD